MTHGRPRTGGMQRLGGRVLRAVLAATIAGAVRVNAAHAAAHAGATPQGWTPVGDAMLADTRGGFDSGNGLLVSLSIDRFLSVNGNVVAASRLAVPDMAQATGGAPSTFPAVPTGAGTPLPPAAPAPLGGLVLQNSANGQLIQGRTTIDATVNSLRSLQGLNFGTSLQQALAAATKPR